MGDADIEEVCGMFDKACSTKYFSDLYKTNKEMMDAPVRRENQHRRSLLSCYTI